MAPEQGGQLPEHWDPSTFYSVRVVVAPFHEAIALFPLLVMLCKNEIMCSAAIS